MCLGQGACSLGVLGQIALYLLRPAPQTERSLPIQHRKAGWGNT